MELLWIHFSYDLRLFFLFFILLNETIANNCILKVIMIPIISSFNCYSIAWFHDVEIHFYLKIQGNWRFTFKLRFFYSYDGGNLKITQFMSHMLTVTKRTLLRVHLRTKSNMCLWTPSNTFLHQKLRPWELKFFWFRTHDFEPEVDNFL